MRKKRIFTPADLGKDIEILMNTKDNLATKSECADWLTKLYIAASKLVIAYNTFTSCQFEGEHGALVKAVFDDFTGTMTCLHTVAEEVLTKMEGM
ncbi:hypothetical protein [Intestinimonas sp.]|uniref:hypothetical protein n=1 Tax=Intestinimonas sp. TaxID=1965293 RepID=UPI00262A871A|nr:hypothetical protein [Intestinimonas sp.]